MSKVSIIPIIVFFVTTSIFAGPLNIKVVYPKPDQQIAAVDSTFIFGSVMPGAELGINGHQVNVHKDGGWLAYLPVHPGEFEFHIRAERGDTIDTLTHIINLPDLSRYTFDSLYIDPASTYPITPLWVRTGDRIKASFSSLPYCNAFCVVEPIGDTIPMKEQPPRHYYSGTTVFDRGGSIRSDIPDSFLIRGVYRGTYAIPETETDSLVMAYHVYPPTLPQLIRFYNSIAPELLMTFPLGKLALLPPLKMKKSSVPTKILDNCNPQVVELRDSLTVIRTGPSKGYLCIHQPEGIRAELAGKKEDWLKLKLSNRQYGWVPDTSVRFLEQGIPVPHSYIVRIRTDNHDDRISTAISTSARHPFRVVENLGEKSITLYIYGVDSDTDWIRYDNSDNLIDHILWYQSEPGLYALKFYLNHDRIWGYDGYYVDNELHFDIKKFPKNKRYAGDFRYVIDPGHSPDPGAIGPTGLMEKDANLAIAKRLERDLRREGAKVVMTRSDDSPLPLYDRPKIALREKGDIFISIHNNALPDGINPFVNNGTSTFYYHPHSASLARAVHRSMVRNLGLNDFGWYHGNLAVNRPTQYPAILVECAFMMIPEHEARLRTNKFRIKISRAIIEGIEDFLRGRPETEWDRQQNVSYDRQ